MPKFISPTSDHELLGEHLRKHVENPDEENMCN
jgi:hypothetical protein